MSRLHRRRQLLTGKSLHQQGNRLGSKMSSDSMTPPSKALVAYRAHCVKAAEKAQESYDKAILSLAAGGLAVSLVYLKDVIGQGPMLARPSLYAAWIAWTTSLVLVLMSFLLSQKALNTAITQVDDGCIGEEQPGRAFATATVTFNVLAGISFIIGVVAMLFFVLNNALVYGGS